jgi:SlyX protein
VLILRFALGDGLGYRDLAKGCSAMVQQDIIDSISEQLIDLQSQVAFQEDTLQSLNEVVTRQQRQIENLHEVLKSQKSQLEAMASEGDEVEERPPHY